jgi:hypothetical protein
MVLFPMLMMIVLLAICLRLTLGNCIWVAMNEYRDIMPIIMKPIRSSVSILLNTCT